MSNSPAPSPLLRRWLPATLTLLAALGVPAAAVSFFTQFVMDHPLLATVIGVLYEAIIFILSFLGKVWSRLESRWVDRIAEWFDHWMLSTLSRYHKQYCSYLTYQHRDFDVKGLSLQGPYALELGQVFIELSIDATTLQDVSANPIQIPKVLAEGAHSIWEYLASPHLTNQHLVVIGPPGSGKTTLLKHITLTLLARGKKRRHYHASIPHKLPVLLFLRDHANAIHMNANQENHDFTLVEALRDHLRKWEQPEPPQGWIKDQLNRGRCLIMLDGLDEVADPQVRKEVVDWVQKQMTAYLKNRFIITSRPFGFRSNPLDRVTVLEVCPFISQQVERFVHKWYLADETMRKQKEDPGVHMRARAEAKDLLQQLYDIPTLLDFTVNPLLLTMITIVHRYGYGGGELPQKRIHIYEEICKVFFGKRLLARGLELKLKPDQMQLVLQPLAYHMMIKGLREITLADIEPIIVHLLESVSWQMSTEKFLKEVENISGLLLEQENGVYTFAHKTFQEYLAAIYIRKNQLGEELIALVSDVWWQETIRLYCAMADATPIVAACLAGDRPSAPALVLALDCKKDALELRPEANAQLERTLNEGIEDSDPERQHVAAEVMLARRLSQMALLKENIFVDATLITCGEYQLFLDEKQAQGKYYQPDHWKNYRFSPGQGYIPILGVRSSDAAAFCVWLNERERGSWFYRLPKVGEINDRDGRTFFSPSNTGYWQEDQKFAWGRNPIQLSADVVNEIFGGTRTDKLDSALQLAHTFNFDLARVLKLAHPLDLVQALERVRKCALMRTHVINFSHNLHQAYALERISYLIGELSGARTRDLQHINRLDRELVRDIRPALEFKLDLDPRFYDNTGDRDLHRTSDLALILIAFFNREKVFPVRRMLIFRRRASREEIQRTLSACIEIFIDLKMFEARAEGKLSACEGILIVKERKA